MLSGRKKEPVNAPSVGIKGEHAYCIFKELLKIEYCKAQWAQPFLVVG